MYKNNQINVNELRNSGPEIGGVNECVRSTELIKMSLSHSYSINLQLCTSIYVDIEFSLTFSPKCRIVVIRQFIHDNMMVMAMTVGYKCSCCFVVMLRTIIDHGNDSRMKWWWWWLEEK